VLREAWGTAVAGQPGLVTIVGEAGIGKTALAEFLAAEADKDGGTVLRTRCYETERSLFLQPIVEAIAPVVASVSASTLRQMLGEHAAAAAGLLPEVAAILGPPPPGRGSMEMERRRAFEAVRAFLRGMAEHNPVLVFVDDLQYAGQSTVELMHFLGREPSGARLLVVATVRAENDAQIGAALDPVARRVEVGPLGPDAVGQLSVHDRDGVGDELGVGVGGGRLRPVGPAVPPRVDGDDQMRPGQVRDLGLPGPGVHDPVDGDEDQRRLALAEHLVADFDAVPFDETFGIRISRPHGRLLSVLL
jgi:hypothetical protein